MKVVTIRGTSFDAAPAEGGSATTEEGRVLYSHIEGRVYYCHISCSSPRFPVVVVLVFLSAFLLPLRFIVLSADNLCTSCFILVNSVNFFI